MASSLTFLMGFCGRSPPVLSLDGQRPANFQSTVYSRKLKQLYLDEWTIDSQRENIFQSQWIKFDPICYVMLH